MFPHSLMTWVGLALVFLAVGLAFGNLILLTGAVFLLLTVLIIASLQPPTGVRLERRVQRMICWAGDSIIVERRLIAMGGIGPIFVHDSLPAEASVEDGNNLRVVWKWTGERTFDVSYRVRFPKRGGVQSASNDVGVAGASRGEADPHGEGGGVHRHLGCAKDSRHHPAE